MLFRSGTGVVFSKKFNALSASYGYFTVGQVGTTGVVFGSGQSAQDLNALDLKYAVSKDLTVGANYYVILDKSASNATLLNHTAGLNAAGKFGPVSLSGALGMQFGKSNPGVTVAAPLSVTGGSSPALNNNGTTAFAASLAAKIAAGPGSVNVAGLYLTGDDGAGYNKAWQPISNGVTYFTPANMWLLTRNAATINSSTAIGGTTDLTRGGLGIKGIFAGYEGTADKVFYSGNVGYAAVANKRGASNSSIGTELNATAGYKLYANLSASVTAAYLILGDGYKKATTLPGGTVDVENPFLTNIQLNYVF